MEEVDLIIQTNTNGDIQKTKLRGILDLKGNIITYDEDNHTSVILDRKNHQILRNNSDFSMKLVFSLDHATQGSLSLQKEKGQMPLTIKTKKLISKDDFYSVDYEVFDSEKIEYQVEIIKL